MRGICASLSMETGDEKRIRLCNPLLLWGREQRCMLCLTRSSLNGSRGSYLNILRAVGIGLRYSEIISIATFLSGSIQADTLASLAKAK